MLHLTSISPHRRAAESGFALVGLVVVIFLILLALSVAAPTVARSLRREREVEAIHRAEQYTRAIRIFYKKVGRYPASLDELQKTNNIRFLRRAYVDPFTGKADWRLIKVGENKTSVKGLFGQPLAGIASSGLGSVAGMQSNLGGTPSASSTGTTPGSTSTTPGTASTGGVGGSGFGSVGSQSATGFAGSGAPFLGVGIPFPGDAITTVNEKNTYPEWEFLYDPRVEQLRSRVNIFGGSMGAMGSTSATTFGSSNSLNSNNNNTFGGSPSGPSTPTPNSPSNTGFGSMSTQP